MCEQLLEVLGTQDADLGEKELTLDEGCSGVVQDSPDGHEVLQLSACLLNNTILAFEDNGHATEVLDFGVANDETVDVEAAGCENA